MELRVEKCLEVKVRYEGKIGIFPYLTLRVLACCGVCPHPAVLIFTPSLACEYCTLSRAACLLAWRVHSAGLFYYVCHCQSHYCAVHSM